MSPRPIVLAGVLYSGEPTLLQVISALEAQEDIDLRIVMIGGYSEWEANRRLYQTFNDSGTDVDLFVRVDSDMLIQHTRLLAVAHRFLTENATVDHLTFAVRDWLSARDIIGMHIWRSTVRWTGEPPVIHVDLGVTTARRRLVMKRPPFPLVLHAPMPSDLQVARYAARRAIKALTTASDPYPWEWLAAFVQHALDHPVRERRLAVAAVRYGLDKPDDAHHLVMANGIAEPAMRELEELMEGWPRVAEETLALLSDPRRRVVLRPPSVTVGIEAIPVAPSESRLLRALKDPKGVLLRRFGRARIDDFEPQEQLARLEQMLIETVGGTGEPDSR